MCVPCLQCPPQHTHTTNTSFIYCCFPILYFLIKFVSPCGLPLSGSQRMFVCVSVCDCNPQCIRSACWESTLVPTPPWLTTPMLTGALLPWQRLIMQMMSPWWEGGRRSHDVRCSRLCKIGFRDQWKIVTIFSRHLNNVFLPRSFSRPRNRRPTHI